MGELNRMTQFKDKVAKFVLSNGTTMIPTGIFMYPVLMASDILLYDADFVPIGADQKQHTELTRNIAVRMNKKYGNLFKIPEPLITKNGARIMDLLDPTIKMSKSNANEKGTIFLLDDPKDAYKKIMGAKTDSLSKINYDITKQPGVSNLLTIYSCITDISIQDLIKKYKNKNYGALKTDLAKIISDFLSSFQSKYKKIIFDKNNLEEILNKNAKKCIELTNNKLIQVYKAIGLI
jgi:tryptophanyl-tRNA synthetase